MEPVSPLSPCVSIHLYILHDNIPGVAHVPRISSHDTDSYEDLTFLYGKRLYSKQNAMQRMRRGIELSRESGPVLRFEDDAALSVRLHYL